MCSSPARAIKGSNAERNGGREGESEGKRQAVVQGEAGRQRQRRTLANGCNGSRAKAASGFLPVLCSSWDLLAHSGDWFFELLLLPQGSIYNLILNLTFAIASYQFSKKPLTPCQCWKEGMKWKNYGIICRQFYLHHQNQLKTLFENGHIFLCCSSQSEPCLLQARVR